MRRPSRLRLARPAHALVLSLARGEDPSDGLHANIWHTNNWHSNHLEPIWNEALGLAERHGIAPLLHEEAQAGRLPGLPEKFRRELRAARTSELAREEKRQRALERALAAIAGDDEPPRGNFLQADAAKATGDDHAIAVLLLKGAASARTLYSAPELRPRSDLDLLIAPADRALALSRLQARGYSQHAKTRGTREDEADWHELTLLDPIDPSQQLDLHFALAQPERHRLNAAVLFAASVREPALGAAARILPAEEAALVAAHSIAVHELAAPLVSLCDFARLLARCDWKRLAAIAEEARLVRALHVATALLAQLGPPASRSSSIFARAEPCAAYSLCGARVEPAQLAQLLRSAKLSIAARRLLKNAAAAYDLSRAPLARARQLWRKALFIDRPRDAARFAASHALRSLRRAALAQKAR